MPDTRVGQAIAALSAKCWTDNPPAFQLHSPQLRALLPALKAAGVLTLIQERLEKLDNLSPQLLRRIREYCREQLMQCAQHELRLKLVYQRLRANGIEPVLIKGWSVTRHYANPMARFTLDVDVCVPREQLSVAEKVISELGLPLGSIDLHGGIDDLADRGWQAVFDRTELEPLHGDQVRVLCPEEQLRLVCLHFWRHRCNRAVWLCDIAALLEARSKAFDWDLCLAGRRRDADRIKAAVSLAAKLLKARLDAPWGEEAIKRLPDWLVNSVLEGWRQRPDSTEDRKGIMRLVASAFFNPLDPIRTVNRLPIGPYHSERTMKWLTRLIMPAVVLIRVVRDTTAPWKSHETATVELHRKVVS
ncbi:MAG: nucleotidyltransferase family protein [Planctomycetota bacterium]